MEHWKTVSKSGEVQTIIHSEIIVTTYTIVQVSFMYGQWNQSNYQWHYEHFGNGARVRIVEVKNMLLSSYSVNYLKYYKILDVGLTEFAQR